MNMMAKANTRPFLLHRPASQQGITSTTTPLLFVLVFWLLPLVVQSDHQFPAAVLSLQKLNKLQPDDYSEFNLAGSYTRTAFYGVPLKLGSPPKEFNLLMDTGSDVPWVDCSTCLGCPKKPEMSYFDPTTSSSVQNISSSFSFGYYDQNRASGYYVSDLVTLDTAAKSQISTPLTFGCTTYRSGTLSNTTADGVIGLGRGSRSFISQLASAGVAPYIFSHCLVGGSGGGGKLILGEVIEPRMVYSPLISKSGYKLRMSTISVEGKQLLVPPVDASIDSGTTYALFPQEVYEPLVDALKEAIPPSLTVEPLFPASGEFCFLFNSSVREWFPSITLQFKGDAIMTLKPENYLRQKSIFAEPWCIAFDNSGPKGVTILGDVILHDKLVTYDIANKQIGWAEYNCSSSFNVNATAGWDMNSSEPGHLSTGCSLLASITCVALMVI